MNAIGLREDITRFRGATRMCIPHWWARLLTAFLLTAGLVAYPMAAEAGPYGATQCAGSRFGSTLACSANDVSLNSIAVVGSFPSTCVGGATIPLDLQVSINFGSSTRYDVGVFLSNDGTDPSLATSGNNCSVAVLPTGSPFWGSVASGGDDDLCGDGGNNLQGSFIMPQVVVPCTTNGSGSFKLYIPYVISWDQSKSNYCADNTYPVPGATSKCNKGTVSFPPGKTIVVLPSVTKTDGVTTVKSGDTLNYTIVVSNTTGSTLVSGVVLTDPAVADLSVGTISCSGSGVSCPSGVNVANLQGGGIILPAMPIGSSLTFTVTAQYTGNPSGSTTLTNTATATMATYPSVASDTDTVMVPPTATKSFSPSSVAVNGTSTLTITLTNPNPVAISGAAFTDSYPSTSIKNASTPALTNSCGGTATGAANASSLSLSGGSIPANGSCSVSVNVTGAMAGVFANSSGLISTTNAGAGTAASGTLVVMSPPIVTESYTPSAISYYAAGCSNCTSTLAITIANSNSVAMTGAAFTDTYSSANLQNTSTATYTCTGGASGSATAAVGGSTLSVSGLSIPAGGSCTVSVTVKGTAPGSYYDTNTGSGTVVSTTNAGTGTATRQTLVVELFAPTVTKIFSPPVIASGGTSMLTISIKNNDATTAITGLGFSDSYPSGMSTFSQLLPLVLPVATTSNCGPLASATFPLLPPYSSVTLSNATIAPNGTCTVTVKYVTATATGNNSVNVTSTNALGGSGTATLYVAKTMVLSPLTQTVPNDGTTQAAITAMITDPAGSAVPGDTITLSCNNHANPLVQTIVTNASGQAVFGITDTSNETVNCTATDSAGLTGSVTVNFSSVSNFNAFESTTTALATSGRIYTKLAGTAFGLDVVAIAGSNEATGFNGSVKVELLANSGTAGYGYDSSNCPTSSSVIQTINSAAIAGGRSTVSFAAVASAYQDVRVRITYSSIVVCSTDSFAIRPSGVTLVTNANAAAPSSTATPTVVAGATFDLYATTSTGANYIGMLALDSAKLTAQNTGTDSFQQSGGVIGTLSLSPATLPVNPVAAPSGNASYTEVGYLYLASGTFRDDSYTNVDPPGIDCVSGSTSDSLAGGLYGCSIGNNTGVSLGRFIPDHFDTAVVQTSGVPMPCPSNLTAGLTCPTLYNGFVYSGQLFTTQVTAKNALCPSGNVCGTTLNYAGSYFAKNVTLSAMAGIGGSTAAPAGSLSGNAITAATFSSGVASTSTPVYTLSPVPTAPVNIYMRADEPSASDGVSSKRASNPTTTSIEGGVMVVSGRIKAANTYGSQLLPQTLAVTVQYYLATGWVNSVTDAVTKLALGYSGLAVTATISPSSRVVSSGSLSVGFAAPGSAGVVTVTPSVDPASPGNPVMQIINGTATFGVYKSNNNYIYRRESY